MKKLFLILILLINISTLAEEKPQTLPGDSIYNIQSKWIDQDGKVFSLSELSGKPTAISMIYLTCKFVCPMTVARMQNLEKLLNPKVKNEVQFILVSFDPERDTPERLKSYAKAHNLDSLKWRFITSQKEQDIRELSALIDFKYKKTADGEFEHSFGIVALDTNGRILGNTFGSEMQEKDLAPLLEKK